MPINSWTADTMKCKYLKGGGELTVYIVSLKPYFQIEKPC